jgi:hypothetical protein
MVSVRPGSAGARLLGVYSSLHGVKDALPASGSTWTAAIEHMPEAVALLTPARRATSWSMLPRVSWNRFHGTGIVDVRDVNPWPATLRKRPWTPKTSGGTADRHRQHQAVTADGKIDTVELARSAHLRPCRHGPSGPAASRRRRCARRRPHLLGEDHASPSDDPALSGRRIREGATLSPSSRRSVPDGASGDRIAPRRQPLPAGG